MLPRENRLTRSADFERVYTQGRGWSDRLLVLHTAPNGLECSRFGFTVSRRVGSAVARNRTKRRIREVVRLMFGRIASGRDVVVTARRSVVGADHADLEHSLQLLLRQAGMLSE